MALDVKSVPNTTTSIPVEIKRILDPIRHNIEVRFLGKSKGSRAVTGNDLVALGLITEADLNKIED